MVNEKTASKRCVACVDMPVQKSSEKDTRQAAKATDHSYASLEAKVLIDNEKDFYHTVISLECKDRPGLLKDLTSCLETAGLTVERVLAKTEKQLAIDTFFVTDSGSKILEEDFEKIEQSILELLEKGAEVTNPFVSLVGRRKLDMQNRDKYVDYQRGIAVVTDNSSSPVYTIVTLRAPNVSGIASQFLANLSYLELNVSFASLTCEGNTRQDVFHVTTLEGRKLDEDTCNEIVNMTYFMLSSPRLEEDSY